MINVRSAKYQELFKVLSIIVCKVRRNRQEECSVAKAKAKAKVAHKKASPTKKKAPTKAAKGTGKSAPKGAGAKPAKAAKPVKKPVAPTKKKVAKTSPKPKPVAVAPSKTKRAVAAPPSAKPVATKAAAAKPVSPKPAAAPKAPVRAKPTAATPAAKPAPKAAVAKTPPPAASAGTGVAIKKPKPEANKKVAPKAPAQAAPGAVRKVINLDEIRLPSGYRPSADEEYMSPQHLAYFKRKLEDWRQELILESQETLEHLRTETRDVGDEAERASRESDNILELRTRDRYRKLLNKIDQALKRIEDGSYGYCEETGEEIGLGRLEARPIATLTVDAQERRELFQRQFRDDH
jgi:DnaK suppressor protein